MDNLTLLQELIARWKAKSPKVFVWITNITLALGIITGIPTTLVALGVDLPEAFDLIINKAVVSAAFAASIIAKITVATPTATANTLEKIDNGVKPSAAIE